MAGSAIAIPRLRHRITGYRGAELFERIGNALEDLKTLYARGTPGGSERDAAIAGGGLVLDKRAARLFWEGKAIDSDWTRHRVPWRFLLLLAAKARYSGSVAVGPISG